MSKAKHIFSIQVILVNNAWLTPLFSHFVRIYIYIYIYTGLDINACPGQVNVLDGQVKENLLAQLDKQLQKVNTKKIYK